MPVMVKRVRGAYRVIEAETGKVATNEQGTPLDGGGHMTQAMAERQAAAVNASLRKAGKIK